MLKLGRRVCRRYEFLSETGPGLQQTSCALFLDRFRELCRPTACSIMDACKVSPHRKLSANRGFNLFRRKYLRCQETGPTYHKLIARHASGRPCNPAKSCVEGLGNQKWGSNFPKKDYSAEVSPLRRRFVVPYSRYTTSISRRGNLNSHDIEYAASGCFLVEPLPYGVCGDILGRMATVGRDLKSMNVGF